MIPRYTRPEMGRIWSEENRFRTWLMVEVAATETLSEAGIVPQDAARAIRERATSFAIIRGCPVDRTAVAISLLRRLDDAYRRYA